MSTRIKGKAIQEWLHEYRKAKRPPLSTVDKILIAAEALKRIPPSRQKGAGLFNDADLIHTCLTLFPHYDGADKDLYLRGLQPTTIPMIRPTLLRDHLFGREAPLKLWMTYNKIGRTYKLTPAGSVYIHKLLVRSKDRAETSNSGRTDVHQPKSRARLAPAEPHGTHREIPASTDPSITPPEPLPMATTPGDGSTSDIQAKPTRADLRAFRTVNWRHLKLVDELGRLNCLKRPLSPLSTDYSHLLKAINYRRDPQDSATGLAFVREAIVKSKQLAMLEAVVNDESADLPALETKLRALDTLLQRVTAIFLRAPKTQSPGQLYQQTGPRLASA